MLSKEEVKKLKREREKILKEIRGIKNLMRGSMYNRERKCGKRVVGVQEEKVVILRQCLRFISKGSR